MIPGSNLVLRDEAEREAPSTLLHGCRSVGRWQLLMGGAMLSMAVTFSWAMLEMQFTQVAIMKLTGRPVPEDSYRTAVFVLAGVNTFLGLLLLWSGLRLRRFARQRLLSGLYPSLCRLRWAWRLLTLVQLLFALALLAALVLALVFLFAGPTAAPARV